MRHAVLVKPLQNDPNVYWKILYLAILSVLVGDRGKPQLKLGLLVAESRTLLRVVNIDMDKPIWPQ